MGTAVAAHDLLQDATLELEANRRACELGNATGCAFTGEARGKDGNIVQARELWAKCESDGRCATDLFWSYAIATPVDLKNADKYGQPACENGNDDVCRKLVSIGSAIDLQAVRQRQHDRQVESLTQQISSLETDAANDDSLAQQADQLKAQGQNTPGLLGVLGAASGAGMASSYRNKAQTARTQATQLRSQLASLGAPQPPTGQPSLPDWAAQSAPVTSGPDPIHQALQRGLQQTAVQQQAILQQQRTQVAAAAHPQSDSGQAEFYQHFFGNKAAVSPQQSTAAPQQSTVPAQQATPADVAAARRQAEDAIAKAQAAVAQDGDGEDQATLQKMLGNLKSMVDAASSGSDPDQIQQTLQRNLQQTQELAARAQASANRSNTLPTPTRTYILQPAAATSQPVRIPSPTPPTPALLSIRTAICPTSGHITQGHNSSCDVYEGRDTSCTPGKQVSLSDGLPDAPGCGQVASNAGGAYGTSGMGDPATGVAGTSNPAASNQPGSQGVFAQPLSSCAVESYELPNGQPTGSLWYKNICSVKLSVVWQLRGDVGGGADIAPGKSTWTTYSRNHVNAAGGARIFVCPVNYVPKQQNGNDVRLDTGIYTCKKAPWA